MSNPATPTDAGRGRVLFFVASCYLIAMFLDRALVTAHEYPMRPEQMMTIAFDVCAVAGLVGLRGRGPQPLFWTALVAGIGLFLIRFTSDAAWWTGHLTYALD
jgi:hypothetical protein